MVDCHHCPHCYTCYSTHNEYIAHFRQEDGKLRFTTCNNVE